MTGSFETVEAALAEVRNALGDGEYLIAHDTADQALKLWPDEVELRHALVLALARTGAVAQAWKQFDELGLDRIRSREVLSLKARLSKDLAIGADGRLDSGYLQQSISDYTAAHEVDPGYFPAINVATLSALAGNADQADRWARSALDDADLHLDTDGYYAEATRAEALLLLGRTDEAHRSLQRAASLPDAGAGVRSTTRKQLRLICRNLGLDDTLLDALRQPGIVHYSGHIIAAPGKPGRFPADQEDEVRREMTAFFAGRRFGRAIGSLAAGADILAAEAALEAGVELVVVLPFETDEFIDISVRPSGGDWVDRFHVCLDQARTVHFVTQDEYLGDDDLFGYATEYALGLTRLRAQWLDAETHQLSVWDGTAGPSAAAGTTHDMEAARRAGFGQTVIRVEPDPDFRRASAGDAPARAFSRSRRGLIFGDFKGFSKLTDRQLPAYITSVLGMCAEVFARYDANLKFSNTWGDGIFLVFDDLGAAANCAFDLQETVAAIDRDSIGLPETFGLRLGFHYGPVYVADDPVLKRPNCFGFHVSRAARIEPITPEGSVYVTEQTAASLAMSCPDDYRCDYVGTQPLAKGYGSFPMYHLRRIGS
ncbi:MAG: tetratricopeptide repeat-containing protein [Minwuia sp.]|uniref:tetratricopeptide repeat-containing protein n=1 Tax=Minwuia sp. TaxID=2493630 RepID=UPI003A83CC34